MSNCWCVNCSPNHKPETGSDAFPSGMKNLFFLPEVTEDDNNSSSCFVVHHVFFGLMHCTIDNLLIVYSIVADKVAKRDPVDELKYAFKLFCGDSPCGKITLADLQRIDETLGFRLTEDEMRSMIEEFDLDQDGCINEAEFIEIMKNSTD